MKKPGLALTFSLLFLPPALSGIKTDRERDGLRGRVHIVRIEKAPLDGTEEGKRVLSQIISYDAKGNKTEVAIYNPDGLLYARWVATYDTEGKELEEAEYNEDGSISAKNTYIYNKTGRKIKEIQYRINSSFDGWSTYKYDARGNITRKTNYKADGSLCSKEVYTYDVNGNKTMQARYDVGCGGQFHLPRKWVYAYDARGNLIERVFYESPDGGYMGKKVYAYNANGEVIEEASYGNDGSLIKRYSYTYGFDSNGNWIKRTPSKEVFNPRSDLEPFEVTYRMISYY